MGKPEIRYRPGSKLYRLTHEDWSRFTARQIADVLESSPASVQKLVYVIRRDTGYTVPYLRMPTIGKSDTHKPAFYWKEETGSPKNCDTCWNFECRILERRRAVTFRHCSGWMPEEDEE